MTLYWCVHLNYKTFELSNNTYYSNMLEMFIPTTHFARNLLEVLQYE